MSGSANAAEALTEIHRHASESARWEMARRPAPALLRPFVREYVGYDEATAVPMRRIEVPHDATVLILNLGDRLRVDNPTDGASGRYRSFFAGLHESFVATETAGSQRGVQVNLTPLGAFCFLGRPQGELANSVVALDDLLGAATERLVERLAETAGWAGRFALVDAFLSRHIAAAPPPAPEVVFAWRRLQATAGNAAIGALASEIGWSRKRLIARFRDQVGLAPKPTAAAALPSRRRPDRPAGLAALGRDRRSLRLLRPGAFHPRVPAVLRAHAKRLPRRAAAGFRRGSAGLTAGKSVQDGAAPPALGSLSRASRASGERSETWPRQPHRTPPR